MASGMGFAELMLLVVMGGTAPADLVTLIHADDYFEVRKIDLTIERMLELAGAEPSAGKAQIQQLLALRVLGDEPAEVKQSKQHQAVLALLRQIASGKKAQDAHGFSRIYAERALARLEGKTPSVPALPKDSLTSDAFRWFPGKVTLIGGADFRGGSDDVDPFAPLRKLISKNVPQQQKSMIYDVAEQLGNLRLDRASFGFFDDPNSDDGDEIYVRFTGKGNAARLVDVLQKKAGLQGAKRGDVTVFTAAERMPAIAIVGDADVLIAGYQRTRLDHEKLLDGVLALRANGEGVSAAARFKEDLQGTPAGMQGVLLGQLPSGLIRELTREGVLPAAPQKVLATLKRDKAVQLSFEASLAGDDEASSVSEAITALRDKSLAALRNVPANAPAPPQVLDNMKKTLASIRTTVNGKVLQGTAQVQGNVGEMLHALVGVQRVESREVEPEPKKIERK